jgi:tetratricopeptide (TPR) repeat protein
MRWGDGSSNSPDARHHYYAEVDIMSNSTRSLSTFESVTHTSAAHRLLLRLLWLLPFVFVMSSASTEGWAQRGGITFWGDVKIDESKRDKPGSLTVTILLYDPSGRVVGRQNVSNNGRYRFTNLRPGEYEIAVEIEDREIARSRVDLIVSSDIGIRHDLEFEWAPDRPSSKSSAGVISAADLYKRSDVNQALFKKAQEAVEKNKHEQAVSFLKQIIESDKLDFQVWTLLGTVYMVQKDPAAAEKAYLSAIEARPNFALALLNLGRLLESQKRFADAIAPLTSCVEAHPKSGEANLLLGEAYLQIKKGSKAIPYLDEAARLDRPEAHLRLGWLYNAAGMKDKAAVEYEEFLKKKPDYPDRGKLKEYISANARERQD